jgi:hypothetical protein
MAGSVALAAAYSGGLVAWVVPTYKNARPLWRFIEQHATGYGDLRRAEMSAQFNTGHVTVYTADNDIALRGEAFDLVVIDEAAQIREETYNDVIIPTLADRDGRIMLISTPKGMNWFHREWVDGKDKMSAEIASFHAPTNGNPASNIQAAFAKIKARTEAGLYPLRSFQQEWLAEFVADGSYFQNIEACCVIENPDQPADHPGHTFGMGIDWGQSSDYTVGTVGCRECDRVVDWFRFNGLSYPVQRARIIEYVKRWPDCRVLPERNSIGQPNIDDLRLVEWSNEHGGKEFVQIALGPDGQYGFNTSATTKPMMIEQLYLALQRGKKYPKEYADEFRAYEVTMRANGAPSFSAPSGQKDDRVISAALENYLSMSALQIF